MMFDKYIEKYYHENEVGTMHSIIGSIVYISSVHTYSCLERKGSENINFELSFSLTYHNS